MLLREAKWRRSRPPKPGGKRKRFNRDFHLLAISLPTLTLFFWPILYKLAPAFSMCVNVHKGKVRQPIMKMKVHSIEYSTHCSDLK